MDAFVDRCRKAVQGPDALASVRAAVEDLLKDADLLATNHPAPTSTIAISGSSEEIFEDETVSIMFVHAPPKVAQPPHDHRMSVVIGGYAGQEVQRFFRRTPGSPQAIEPSGGATIASGDVLTLGAQAVHAIDAAGPAWSSAVHVYLGKLSVVERSLFHPETFVEEPLDLKKYDSYCVVG